MKVYIVTQGAYSDYEICQVFLDKEKAEKYLFVRCIISTICGEGLDAIIFISIAFYGTMPVTSLLIMIIAQAGVKTIYEIIVYPVTRFIIYKIRELPD